MPTNGPAPIPYPLSSFPGANAQESAGRLINCYAENLGDPQQQNYGAPKDGAVWRRSPGLTQFALTGQTGYRGGMEAAGVSYEVFNGQAVTLDSFGQSTPLGSFPGNLPISIAINQNATSPDVVAVDPVTGAFVLHSAVIPAMMTMTLSGSPPNGVAITMTFTNPDLSLTGFPLTIQVQAIGGATLAVIAANIVTAINNNAVLSAASANVSATLNGLVITISQTGLVGNTMVVTSNHAPPGGAGAVVLTPSPSTGAMSGGAGIAGVFTGTPTFYNGQTSLPAVNSVSFQDGYFFFTTAQGRVYASGLNALTQNALTFIVIQAKADVTLLRGIPYQGYMFFFTTGSCEVWQDQAIAAPEFPYARNAILATSLIQSSAIAGFETGFDNLMWVAADYGVYNLPIGGLTPTKVSPPDLDRLIETQVKAGNTIWAAVYIFAGKKVWVLTSPAWTWEFHLNTQKWFERASLQPNGAVGQWRGLGGHPAFGQWLMGDDQSTAIVYPDDTNPYDVLVQDPITFQTAKVRMLMRLESGMVDRFPIRGRVCRADFHFVQGVGMPVAARALTVTGTAAGFGGVVRLAVLTTLGANDGDQVQVANVGGTIEANGVWTITVIDGTHMDLAGTTFVNAYTSGGIATDLSADPDLTNPTVAISWSDDGGHSYRPPVLRNLGPLSVIKTGRVAVKNAGLTSQIGRRWRMDITAPVYTAFLKATQSDNPTTPQ